MKGMGIMLYLRQAQPDPSRKTHTLIVSHQDRSKKSAEIWFYVQKSKHFDSPFLFRIFRTPATHSIPFSAFPLPSYILHCTEPLYPGHS
jgi:hypothetical protein